MNPTDYLTKLAECGQQGKVLDMATGQCVDAFPPGGYTPPGTTIPGNVPPPPWTVPGNVPPLPTGHVLIQKADLDRLEKRTADLESTVRTWQIATAVAGGVALIAGTVVLFK